MSNKREQHCPKHCFVKSDLIFKRIKNICLSTWSITPIPAMLATFDVYLWRPRQGPLYNSGLAVGKQPCAGTLDFGGR